MALDAGVRYFCVTYFSSIWCNLFYFLVTKDVLLPCVLLPCAIGCVTSLCRKSCYFSCFRVRVSWVVLLACNDIRVTSVCHKRYLLVTVRHFIVTKVAPLPCEISDISSYNQSSSTVLRTDQTINNRRLFVFCWRLWLQYVGPFIRSVFVYTRFYHNR